MDSNPTLDKFSRLRWEKAVLLWIGPILGYILFSRNWVFMMGDLVESLLVGLYGGCIVCILAIPRLMTVNAGIRPLMKLADTVHDVAWEAVDISTHTGNDVLDVLGALLIEGDPEARA